MTGPPGNPADNDGARYASLLELVDAVDGFLADKLYNCLREFVAMRKVTAKARAHVVRGEHWGASSCRSLLGLYHQAMVARKAYDHVNRDPGLPMPYHDLVRGFIDPEAWYEDWVLRERRAKEVPQEAPADDEPYPDDAEDKIEVLMDEKPVSQARVCRLLLPNPPIDPTLEEFEEDLRCREMAYNEALCRTDFTGADKFMVPAPPLPPPPPFDRKIKSPFDMTPSSDEGPVFMMRRVTPDSDASPGVSPKWSPASPRAIPEGPRRARRRARKRVKLSSADAKAPLAEHEAMSAQAMDVALSGTLATLDQMVEVGKTESAAVTETLKVEQVPPLNAEA